MFDLNIIIGSISIYIYNLEVGNWHVHICVRKSPILDGIVCT